MKDYNKKVHSAFGNDSKFFHCTFANPWSCVRLEIHNSQLLNEMAL